ncbi:hypothetical protein DFQ28_008029 [Apophysomyces sp. BC1034]|nr:hypothetical protein DFQ30_011219 [Apophysomyces sp. BC1015]KAG0182004.1 hypothetical protein DFQ29_006122 [Apophysomyces sp. BC1021]KAG0186314.1 hypothetical protein DFQ28_008029 [Apophysomyces sp. BC1034]
MAAISQSIRELVKKVIADNKVTVFSKSYCPYCTGAKDLLDDLHVDYNAIELNERQDGADIQQALAELTGQKTVPNIFINRQHIGGYSDFKTTFDSGKLTDLLTSAGIKHKL